LKNNNIKQQDKKKKNKNRIKGLHESTILIDKLEDTLATNAPPTNKSKLGHLHI